MSIGDRSLGAYGFSEGSTTASVTEFLLTSFSCSVLLQEKAMTENASIRKPYFNSILFKIAFAQRYFILQAKVPVMPGG